jgi:copper(I)-binding protein
LICSIAACIGYSDTHSGYSVTHPSVEGQVLILIRKVLCGFVMVVGLFVAASTVWSEVEVQEAYVRGLPPGQTVTAAFMRLVNKAKLPVEIVSADSDSAERAEIHAHRHHNGMMSMEPVASITVPAEGEFVLAPGEYHLMLINLHQPLADGDSVTIRLRTASGKVITAQLPVQSVLNEHKHH